MRREQLRLPGSFRPLRGRVDWACVCLRVRYPIIALPSVYRPSAFRPLANRLGSDLADRLSGPETYYCLGAGPASRTPETICIHAAGSDADSAGK